MEKIERDGREQHLFKYSLWRTSTIYLTSEYWIPDMVGNLATYTERFDQAIVWYDAFASQFDRIIRKAYKTIKEKQTTENGYVEKEQQKTVPTYSTVNKTQQTQTKNYTEKNLVRKSISLSFIFTVYWKRAREIGKIMITVCMTLRILHKWGNCSHNKDN